MPAPCASGKAGHAIPSTAERKGNSTNTVPPRLIWQRLEYQYRPDKCRVTLFSPRRGMVAICRMARPEGHPPLAGAQSCSNIMAVESLPNTKRRNDLIEGLKVVTFMVPVASIAFFTGGVTTHLNIGPFTETMQRTAMAAPYLCGSNSESGTLDAFWTATERTAAPAQPVYLHDPKLAGKRLNLPIHGNNQRPAGGVMGKVICCKPILFIIHKDIGGR